MKQLRLFLLALLLGLVSCFTDDFSPPGGEGEPADPHAVGMDRALADLQSVLTGIDGPTRSASRTIGTVGTVSKADVSRTRASAEGNLVYVVSFPEGGYAVLGADDRLPSVIAVVEQGSLTAERYAEMALDGVPVDPSGQPEVFPDIVFDEEDLAAFGIGDGPIGGGGIGGIGGNGPFTDWETHTPGFTTSYGPWENVSSKVLLLTKWSQGSPYNMYAPSFGDRQCPAGCVAIAVAQIMTYHAYTSHAAPSTIYNTTINWNAIINTLPYKPTLDNNDQDAHWVAQLLRMIGYEVKMNYGFDGSGAYTKDAAIFFGKYGYQNVKMTAYSTAAVQSMLGVNRPVYISATDQLGSGGHAWVLDGLLKQERTKTFYKNGGFFSSDTEERMLFHCNFGWGGYCDGFYSSSSFDLRSGPDQSEGNDWGGSTNAIYSDQKMVILYSNVIKK